MHPRINRRLIAATCRPNHLTRFRASHHPAQSPRAGNRITTKLARWSAVILAIWSSAWHHRGGAKVIIIPHGCTVTPVRRWTVVSRFEIRSTPVRSGLRAGFVTTAYRNGVPDEEIMGHTRHRRLTQCAAMCDAPSSAGKVRPASWGYEQSHAGQPRLLASRAPDMLAIADHKARY
jgi:hypothetical protein